ncbi:unnamed protein product [Arctia plantaginis]|uniref:STAS domain-containing protein n=1 Tax=Arctia plantaginis TaxID=874455 RepID=A0A8S1BVH8_ARCPL|nr:unnamed protein product [Arctia plantaginis]
MEGGGSRLRRSVANGLWFLSTTRNILVVLVCAALAYYFDTQRKAPFVLTGEVKPGLPEVSLPPFSATVGNHTYTFSEMASTLAGGKYVDATRERVAGGATWRARGASIPGVGRAVARPRKPTPGRPPPPPAASTPARSYLSYILTSCQNRHNPSRGDVRDLLDAAAGAGLVIGIAVNLVFLLYASARPSVKVSTAVSPDGVEHVVAVVDRSLSFPSAEFVRRALRKAAQRHAHGAPLVLDATHVQAADFTAAKGIKALIDDFHQQGQPIIFYNVKPSIAEVFRGVRPREFLHCSCRPELDRLLLEASARSRRPPPPNIC